MLKTDVKHPTATTIANMRQTHKAAADVILNADESLSSLKTCSAGDLEFPCLHDVASSGIIHRQGKASRGKAKAQPKQRVLCDRESTSEFPCIDKCLKGSKDPIVAATKVRKVTIRDVEEMEVKATRARTACQEALALIQDDFDSEEHMYQRSVDTMSLF